MRWSWGYIGVNMNASEDAMQLVMVINWNTFNVAAQLLKLHITPPNLHPPRAKTTNC